MRVCVIEREREGVSESERERVRVCDRERGWDEVLHVLLHFVLLNVVFDGLSLTFGVWGK